MMHTTTRTHGHCAVQGCVSPTRRDLIGANEGRWHLVNGHVYVQERRTLVAASWAEACEPHRDAVTAAVRADVHDWHDRWEVQVGTYDYATPEAGGTETIDHCLGTDHGRLF